MVIDKIENLSKYESLNSLFGEVVNFIKNNDLNKLEIGKHQILGDDLFVNIQIVKSKSKEEALLETHKKMIDIQIPLSSPETYGYTSLTDLPKADYNEDKDISKYEGLANNYITCKPGELAIFFPQDGHAPCISNDLEIKKAIFKIKVDL